MGVPGFFRWLVNRYPLTRQNMHDPSQPRFNNLYIDMNGILYKAAEITHIKENRLTPDFAAEMCRYLDMLVQFCRPTDTLFIAVDGCAPSAKNLQQRSRRFKSGHDMHPGSFDRCNFTAGTPFMNDINNYLLKFIKEKKQNDSAWRTPKVVYSSSFVPGEGEHKILDWIRSCRHQSNWKPNMTHILYSTDADLIFLTLRTHEPYFSILREADSSAYQKPKEKFEYSETKMKWDADAFEILNINLVREYLSVDFNVKGEELEKTIDDFVAISFLVGNDFIPEFSDIVIQKGSFNTIINCFKEVRTKRNNEHLIINGDFNKSFLKELFTKIVSELENVYNEQNEKNPEKISYEQYNRNYILSKYPDQKDNYDALIKDMAFNIFNAFYWVLQYYESGCPSWIWSYRYHYSPPLQLVIPFIDQYEPHFELGTPTRPLLQQLFVLPPQSADLMPKKLRELIVPPSPIADLYPTDFEIDLNGKKNDYQATILIPILDFDRVRTEYNKIRDQLSPEDLERDKVMKPLLFENDKEPVEIDFTPCILDSTNRTTELPACVPSLNTLSGKISFELKKADVVQFEFPSKLESVVITVNNSNRDISFQDATKNLLNKQIVFGWPYLKLGTIVAVSNGENTAKANELMNLPHFRSFNRIHSDLLSKYAIEVGKINIALQVVTTVPLNIDQTEFSNVGGIETVPYQLTFDPVDDHHQDKFNNVYSSALRFKTVKTVPPQVGSPVLFTSGVNEGNLGKVTQIINPNQFNILAQQRQPKAPPVAQLISNDAKQWIPDTEVAKVLQMPFKLLNKLISTVYIKGEGVDVAFTLFTKQKTHVIDSVCKIGEDGKSYSIEKSVLPLIQTYLTKTGKLVDIITELQNSKTPKANKNSAFEGKGQKLSDPKPSQPANKPKTEGPPPAEPLPVAQKKLVTLEGMYGGTEEHQKAKLKELTDWLIENSPAAHFPMVPVSKKSLAHETIKNIETQLVNYNPKIVEKETKDVKDNFVKWSTKRQENGSLLIPQIGSRVAYIAGCGPAPFGSFGYVVAADAKERKIIVVFDKELECGTKLEGLLQTNRGLQVNCNDVMSVY